MIKRWTIAAAASLSTLALAGCSTMVLAPAGAYTAQPAYAVTLSRPWTDVSAAYASPKSMRLLTIDGVLLNRLYLVGGLKPGETMFKGTKDKPTPTIREGMSASERMEFITDNVALLGFLRIETSRPRPAKFGGADGLRFDINAKTSEGLDVKGSAQVAESGGKFYAILYLAPAEHYFQATLPEAEAVMASAQLKG